MKDKPNNRKFPRARTSLEVQGKAPRKPVIFDAKVLNLSEGGVFLGTPEGLLVGQEVILTFTLEFKNQKKTFMALSKVIWIHTNKSKKPIGYGMAFLNCNETTKKFIRDYVSFLLTGELSVTGTIKDPSRGQLRG